MPSPERIRSAVSTLLVKPKAWYGERKQGKYALPSSLPQTYADYSAVISCSALPAFVIVR